MNRRWENASSIICSYARGQTMRIESDLEKSMGTVLVKLITEFPFFSLQTHFAFNFFFGVFWLLFRHCYNWQCQYFWINMLLKEWKDVMNRANVQYKPLLKGLRKLTKKNCVTNANIRFHVLPKYMQMSKVEVSPVIDFSFCNPKSMELLLACLLPQI